MLTRRHVIALAAAPALAPGLSIAQTPKVDFPNKPVRLIVPVAAGGPTDIVARMLAEKLSTMWGQQVVVENKGGAGTNIGNEYAARSDPDGYAILFATASLAVMARSKALLTSAASPSTVEAIAPRPSQTATMIAMQMTTPAKTNGIAISVNARVVSQMALSGSTGIHS